MLPCSTRAHTCVLKHKVSLLSTVNCSSYPPGTRLSVSMSRIARTIYGAEQNLHCENKYRNIFVKVLVGIGC